MLTTEELLDSMIECINQYKKCLSYEKSCDGYRYELYAYAKVLKGKDINITREDLINKLQQHYRQEF